MEELNFKKWLEEHGVYTKLFWENCKKKNQRWSDANIEPISRKNLFKQPPENWIVFAFDWEKALRSNRHFWNDLNKEWVKAVDEAEEKDTEIVGGFIDGY